MLHRSDTLAVIQRAGRAPRQQSEIKEMCPQRPLTTDPRPEGQTPNGPCAKDQPIKLRRLSRWDRAEHLGHLRRLSLADRHARFQGGMSDAALERYSHRLDWTQTDVIGIFADGKLRGMAELFPLGDPREGELSISVEGGYQHFGYGRKLVQALLDAARMRGMRAVHMFFFRDNQGMHALARRMGASSRLSGGVLEGIVRFNDPQSRRHAA